ncbi:oligosaccharide flippase family protein [bacterium]|nr:oligosaccharide flippase family protein [bacterium]
MKTDPAKPTDAASRISRGMVRGTAGFAMNRALDALIGFLLVPFILHRLGAEAYGLWALLYAVVAYFNLADLGFGASLNRNLTIAISSDDADEKYRVFSTSFLFFAAFALFLLLLGFLAEPLIFRFYHEVAEFEQEGRWVWRCMIWILASGYFSNYARALIIASHRADRLATLHMIIGVLNAGMTVFVLSMGWGILGLAFGSAIFSLVRLSIFYGNGLAIVPNWKIGLKYWSISVFRAMWKFGITVQFSRFAEMINMQFDRLLLGRVIGLNSVTHYDLGAKGASSANLVSQVTLYVVEPAAAAFSTSGDYKRFEELLRRSGKYVAILSLPVGIAIIVLAVPLLTVWLGSVPHPDIILTIRILIATYLMSTLTQPLRLCARGAGFPGWEAKTGGIQALLNVSLSIGLYYTFGFVGVLLGSFIAATIGQMSFTLIALRGLKQSIRKFFFYSWGLPLLTALIAGLGCKGSTMLIHPLSHGVGRIDALPELIAGVLVFGILYTGSLFLFRVLNLQEIKGVLDRFHSGEKG